MVKMTKKERNLEKGKKVTAGMKRRKPFLINPRNPDRPYNGRSPPLYRGLLKLQK